MDVHVIFVEVINKMARKCKVKWRNTDLNVSLYWPDFFSTTTLKWSPQSMGKTWVQKLSDYTPLPGNKSIVKSDQSKDRKQKPLNRFLAAKRNFEFCEASAVFKTPLFWPASSRDLRLASGRFFPSNETIVHLSTLGTRGFFRV